MESQYKDSSNRERKHLNKRCKRKRNRNITTKGDNGSIRNKKIC